MTTTTLHANVRRIRFVQHALAALSRLAGAAWSLTPRVVQPTPAESASREAQNVRALARSYSRTDPSFAADLYAAAARHEGLHAD